LWQFTVLLEHSGCSWEQGAGGHDADTSLGVVFERRLLRVAPVVLMAAGLGLIGAVIRISLEAV
jgi:hypothetical protein